MKILQEILNGGKKCYKNVFWKNHDQNLIKGDMSKLLIGVYS